MPLQQLFTSRKSYNASEYVARIGKLFYDEATGYLRLGDGTTPGGKVVGNLALAAVSLTPPINPYEGELWYNPNTKELWSYYNGQFRGTINAATTSTIGGIKAGPGVVVASDGTLSLDSTGIPFNFGDFYAFTNTGPNDGACLSSINLDQDVNIISNGTGTVNIVGIFNVHKTNNTVEEALAADPIFKIDTLGKVFMRVPVTSTDDGAVQIIGSALGNTQAPGQFGAMLHITGIPNTAARVYIDGNGNYPSIVGRRWNGTLQYGQTQVLANDDILRINATAYNSSGMASTASVQIRMYSLDNQTSTTQGGAIDFVLTPKGQPTSARVTATTITSTGTTSLRFFGPLTGDVTGLITTAAQPNITSVGTLTNLTVSKTIQATTGTFTQFTGKFVRNTRDAGTIGAGGTLTIDFTTDSLVYCTWSTGLVLAYQNYLPGSVVRVIATKATGSGNNAINLGGVTATHVSNGSTTTGNYTPDTSAFLELTCVGTTIGTVYVKL